jgi:hypothetical protein
MAYHPAVASRPGRNPDRSVNRHRQHKAVVVIGVFPNQVDPARRAHHERGQCSQLALERPD